MAIIRWSYIITVAIFNSITINSEIIFFDIIYNFFAHSYSAYFCISHLC